MSSSPLAGLLVADLSRHLPGPYCARILADLGARVVKVEEPELGDPVRHAPPLERGRSALAAALLAGLESIALDLRREAARGVLARLVERADVVLESFRPGGLERLVGASPEALAERHPRLVVCSISGWGQEGPERDRAGHDLTYQAMAGALAPTGGMPQLPAADLLGGWSAATAILAALLERGTSGRGSVIDAALVDAAGHGNLMGWVAETERRHPVGEPLALTGAYPCYQRYRTRDGAEVVLACLEPRFWKRFCERVGRRDLVAHQYRADPASHRKVARLIATRSRADWQELFAEEDLPAGPVLAAAESRDHPQVRTRALLEDDADGLPRLGFPALVGGERPRSPGRVPELGEDTGELLAELGCPEAALGRRARRAAGIGPRRSLKGTLWRLASRSKG